jgi:hypothetical protein
MSAFKVLTVDEVRQFVGDYAPQKYLIDGEEFSDTDITLCMKLALDSFNAIPPMSQFNPAMFPYAAVLLYGTCWHMYLGKAALLAANTMNYSDGGLQVPIEERAELYQGLAANFNNLFITQAREMKKQMNMDSGWGHLGSDESVFPYW